MKNRNYYQAQNKMLEIYLNLKAIPESIPELENYIVNSRYSTHPISPKI